MRRWENQTPEQIARATEPARRNARFNFAKTRVTKIADGDPPLSRSQFIDLANILLAAAGDPR